MDSFIHIGGFYGAMLNIAWPIKRCRENYLPALHFSEQYFTFTQSRAHFLRHSKARLQRWQILGAKPFFVFAFTESRIVELLQSYSALVEVTLSKLVKKLFKD
jgi:hypothetical protein